MNDKPTKKTTFETIKNAVSFSSDCKYSTDFFKGYCGAAVREGDNTKILTTDQCAELAECSIYTLDEIKNYFWNGVD